MCVYVCVCVGGGGGGGGGGCSEGGKSLKDTCTKREPLTTNLQMEVESS